MDFIPATRLPAVQMAGDLEGECMSLDLFIFLNTVSFFKFPNYYFLYI